MPEQFSVRRAKPAQLDQILEIERGAFRKDAYDRKLFAAYMRKCGDYFLVAHQAGEIRGYMLTCLVPGRIKAAELISIAVARSARGTGAAAALMESTLRRLRRRGIVRLVLMVKVTNRRARRFYEKYGFDRVRVVEGYYEDGRDGVVMERVLGR